MIPQSPEAERAILGCVLQDSTLAGELDIQLFYDERHKGICQAIQTLLAAGKPVDEVSVRIALGIEYTEIVGKCLDSAPSSANFAYWRDILDGKRKLRDVLKVCTETKEEIEKDPSDLEGVALVDKFAASAVSVGMDAKTGERTADDAIGDMFDELEAISRGVTITTGLHDLDRLVKLRPGQFVVCAARPSQGKTALACRFAARIAYECKKGLGIVSLEMSAGDLMRRITSGVSGVPYTDFENPEPGQQNTIVETIRHLKTCPLYFSDRAGQSMAQIAGLARKWKLKHNIQCIIIDYLGLIRLPKSSKNRYEGITEVSKQLKCLARDLGIVVVVLAQLNRVAADSERPMLHHLRDSGDIEQDADIVILIHRKEVPGSQDQTQLLVDKQRNGAPGVVPVVFNKAIMRFESAAKVDSNDFC